MIRADRYLRRSFARAAAIFFPERRRFPHAVWRRRVLGIELPTVFASSRAAVALHAGHWPIVKRRCRPDTV